MNRRFVVYGLILTLLLAAAAFLGRGLGTRPAARFPSSFAAEPEGLLAFRRLLDALAVPNRVLASPLTAEAPPPQSLLVVATPLQRPFRAEEIPALRRWLERGGRLLVVDDATTIESSGALDDFLAGLGLDRVAPDAEPDLRTLKAARPATSRATGTEAVPSSPRFRNLALHRDARFEGEFRGIPLAIAIDGDVVAAEVIAGEGRVVRVLGALLARDLVLAGDNLELALALIDDLRAGGPVLFDEYHQGFGSRELESFALDSVSLKLLLAQSFVLLFLFGAARGRRFGPPRPDPEPQRRSSLEFVRSMASLYRRAGFRRDTLRRLARGFRQRVEERYFPAVDLNLDVLARDLSSRCGVPAERIRRTLLSLERGAADPRLTERRMLIQARQLDELEREVFRDG